MSRRPVVADRPFSAPARAPQSNPQPPNYHPAQLSARIPADEVHCDVAFGRVDVFAAHPVVSTDLITRAPAIPRGSRAIHFSRAMLVIPHRNAQHVGQVNRCIESSLHFLCHPTANTFAYLILTNIEHSRRVIVVVLGHVLYIIVWVLRHLYVRLNNISRLLSIIEVSTYPSAEKHKRSLVMCL